MLHSRRSSSVHLSSDSCPKTENTLLLQTLVIKMVNICHYTSSPKGHDKHIFIAKAQWLAQSTAMIRLIANVCSLYSLFIANIDFKYFAISYLSQPQRINLHTKSRRNTGGLIYGHP